MGKYRYLTFEDRKKIEAWHLLGDRPVDIAARLSVHHTTIYKELQRGATGALDANQREGYSAELAERRLRESFKRRGKRAPAAPGRRKETPMRSRRNNTTLTRKVDKWNPRKVWLIKRYADGHYAINQEVGGRVFYSSYQRATKAQIAAIFACC